MSLDEMAGDAWLVDEREDSSPSHLAEFAEVKKIMAGAIDRLPEKERLVVALYYYEGLTLKEIGITLGLSEGRISVAYKSNSPLTGCFIPQKTCFSKDY